MRVVHLSMAIVLLCASAWAQNASGSTASGNPKGKELDQADAAMTARDYRRAVELLLPLAASSPRDARILYDLGAAQDALDEAAPAEQSYRASIGDDSRFLDPHIALGLMLARNGSFEGARTELLFVRTITSEDAALRARAFRALARLDAKERPAEARDELLQALKLTPETTDDILLGAELAGSAAGGNAAAEQAYRRVLRERPNDAEATAALAGLLVRELRAPEAETLLAAALLAHPGDPGLTVQLATLYAHGGETAKAVPLIEQLYRSDPANALVGHLLAGLYLDTSDYEHAEPILAALAQLKPRDGTLVDERARALIQLKRFAEAQTILARVVPQPGLFPTAADLGNAAGDLAFAASSNNDPQACLQALEVRATVLPPSAPVLFLKAISLDKLHQIKLAREAYRLFLDASKGAHPDEEFEARHRLIALEHMK